MGKTKNRKYRKKDNPTGLPSVQSVELEDDERGMSSHSNPLSKNEHLIQTILEQLETPGVDGKLCALTTMATLTDDHEFVEDLVNHNIIKIAGPLLVDPSSSIRNAAALALRNLSGMGMPEICDLLVEEDVLTCVFTLLNKYYSSNWISVSENGDSMAVDDQNDKKAKKRRSRKESKHHSDSVALIGEDLLTSTFTQAVHILWNLCKSSDLAVKIFNQQNVLPVLARYLDPKECGIEPAVAVAHCLHTVTEDNEVAALELRQSSEDVLLKIISPAFEEERAHCGKPSKFLLLRVLAAGIIMNITKGSSDLAPVLNARVGLAISDAISEDHRVALSGVSNVLHKERQESSSSPTDSESMDEGEMTLDFQIEETESLIAAQTIAVELLTNLYYKEDEDDDWADSDGEDMSNSETVNNRFPMADGLPEMEEAFGGKGHIDNIVKKIEKDDGIWKELENQPDTKCLISRVNILRCRSLLCLHNVITSLQDEDLGGFTGVLTLWDKLGNLVLKDGTEDTSLLEATSAAMRAVAERLKRIDPRSFACNVTSSGLQMLFNVEKKCTDPNTRANLIRTVGIMGEALCHSNRDEINTLLGQVGSFLLQISTRADEELWVVAEALDALMDVFAEDSTDPAAAEIGLVDSLRSMLPALRSKLRQQRKSLGHHAAIIVTANTNLERFVKYKAEHICNGTNTEVR